MRFDLDADYCIISDEYNFTLMFKRVVLEGQNAGKHYETPVSYHSRLEDALRQYVKKAFGTSDVVVSLSNFQPVLDALAQLDVSVKAAGAAFIDKFPPPISKHADSEEDRPKRGKKKEGGATQ